MQPIITVVNLEANPTPLTAHIIHGWCNHTKVKSRNTEIAHHLQEGADVLRHAVEGSRRPRVHQAGRRGGGGGGCGRREKRRQRPGMSRRQRRDGRRGGRGGIRGALLLIGDALLHLLMILCVRREGREL